MRLTGPWHVGSSHTRARTRVPCISRQILNHCATREALKCFLFHVILFFVLFGHAACGILVPPSGIEPVSPALEEQSLNHWTAREVPISRLDSTKTPYGSRRLPQHTLYSSRYWFSKCLNGVPRLSLDFYCWSSLGAHGFSSTRCISIANNHFSF